MGCLSCFYALESVLLSSDVSSVTIYPWGSYSSFFSHSFVILEMKTIIVSLYNQWDAPSPALEIGNEDE